MDDKIILPKSPVEDDDNSSINTDYSDEYSIIKYTNKFIDNEKQYYDIIQSYCYGNKIELFLEENKEVISAAYLNEDSTVNQHMLYSNNEHKEYDSIYGWVNAVKGKILTGKELIEIVYIGDNYVPLWRVMLDAIDYDISHREDSDDESELEHMVEEHDERNYGHRFMLLAFIFYLIVLLFVLTLLTIIIFSNN